MTTLLIGLARGISKNIHHDSHSRDNHTSSTPRQTTIMTLPPSQFNPEYAAPAHVPRDEPPPPYTEVAPPEARIAHPQPQAQAPSRMPTQRRTQPPPQGPSQPQPVVRTPIEAQIPTRNAGQSQPRAAQPKRAPSQSQPETRTNSQSQSQAQSQSQSQSQPQRSASVIRHRTTLPSYQQPHSQEPAGYVVIDAAPGAVGVCDCVYKDGFGLAPKCRRCERQARRGHHGTGERRRRRQRDGPIGALVDEIRK
jgi:hypothetical protein